jgi:hypothetical protein
MISNINEILIGMLFIASGGYCFYLAKKFNAETESLTFGPLTNILVGIMAILAGVYMIYNAI